MVGRGTRCDDADDCGCSGGCVVRQEGDGAGASGGGAVAAVAAGGDGCSVLWHRAVDCCPRCC